MRGVGHREWESALVLGRAGGGEKEAGPLLGWGGSGPSGRWCHGPDAGE